ncbi:MAG TPA: DUF3090 domain-containing protein [Actinomycetales bacterium]|nr:DUF3090 domain-containing protein [Actinomycetales bacterium]
MPRQVFEYDPPDRFVAGTVGTPGSRTFFLQARGATTNGGSALTSVALEKQQVAALAERVEELLDEVVRRSGGTAPVPAVAPSDAEDLDPMDSPIEEEFRVGTMSLTWDGDRQLVLIECFEVGEDPDEEVADLGDPLADVDDDRSVLRVAITGTTARAFAKRALALVAAGRPPCPFCAGPIDPEGHVCPRANGYRR